MVYAGINPQDIDGFIDCAVPQDDGTDTNYLIVIKKLCLNNAIPLSLFTACTSFISAVEAAAAYVRAGHRKRVLVCATQIGSHIADPTSPAGSKLADGAVAAIVSQVQPGQGYQGSHGSALSEFCGAMDLSLKPPYMHLESPTSLNLCSYLHPGDVALYDKTFSASVKEMVAVCRTALQRSGITDNSKVLLAPHQPNSELPLLWARELGIKRIHFSWKKYGTMGPACPAVNLFQAIEQGELCAGEIALLAAPGISMQYYALVECITSELVHAVTGN
jgi:3-oxoacyl-[acyl-carrier-protein] synthase-3